MSPKEDKKFSEEQTTEQLHGLLNTVTDSRLLQTLDVQGLNSDEAIRRIRERLDELILSEVERFKISHGILEKELGVAIHTFLATLKIIKGYKADPRNPGVTWVQLK